MAIVAEISGKATTVFPENKIVLLSGRSLDCYPLPPSEGVGAEVMGKEECELFVRNAFYLCAHRERIMSDSRMFLCPVAVRNGLAYTGTAGFTRPTLGVYLEW